MKIIIVGAGLAGAVAARLLADEGHQVEIFESRNHIAGNCYDEWQDGVLVHRYGPHGFHTDKAAVWEFVNRFSKFHLKEYEVVANTKRGLIPVPYNDISEKITGELTAEEIRNLIFVDYSEKHWGIPWEQIPKSITSRVPQRRIGRDCRYHLDQWQGIPGEGYTRMFEAMLEGIPVHLNAEPEAWRKMRADHVVFTGSIDDYFNHAHGKLEYRSLRFEYEVQPKREYLQINECNPLPWTRSVDHSHWLDQAVEKTVISREYPCEWDGSNTRFYPKPFGGNTERFQKYWDAAKVLHHVTFLGRLATYKYLDMDDVIAQVMVKLGKPAIAA